MRLILLGLIVMKCVHCDRILVPERISLIRAVKNYFRSGCIYIVEARHTIVEGLLRDTDLHKNLSEEGLAIGTLSFEDVPTGVLCRANRPIFVISTSDGSETLLQVFNRTHMADFFWLLFMDLEVELEHFFSDTDIPFDCEFLTATKHDDTIVVMEIYRIKQTLPLQIHHFGNWTEKSGLHTPKIGVYERRNNLQGLAINVGFKEEDRIASFTKERHTPSGMMGDVWTLLERQINFTSVYHRPHDNLYGGKMKNGSWTGIIGMLQRYEVDYSICDFFMLKDRLEAADFTVPVFITKYVLIIREPTKFDLKWNTFLLPFSSGFWATVLIATLVCIACLATAFHVDESEAAESSLISATFHTLGVLCQQGSGDLPKSTPVRLTFMTLHLTSVVLFASYSAAYISYLTLRNPSLPFTNFEEFLGDGAYNLEMMPSSAALEFFKSSRIELLRDIYKKMIMPHEVTLPTQDLTGLQRMCSGTHKYSFFTSSYRLMMIGQLPNCNFVLIPQAYCPGTAAFPTTKKNPYKRLFDHKLQEMRRDGTLAGVYKRFSYRLHHIKGITTPTVNITDVAPIIIVLLVGTLIASLIFTIEYLVKKLLFMYKKNINIKKTDLNFQSFKFSAKQYGL